MIIDLENTNINQLASSGTQPAIISYLNFLNQQRSPLTTMLDSLQLADQLDQLDRQNSQSTVTEAGDYFNHLITNMLANWTKHGYQQLLTQLPSNLKTKICLQLPYLQLPTGLQHNYNFICEWAKTKAIRGFIVDGQLCHHNIRYRMITNQLMMVVCYSADNSYIVYWSDGGWLERTEEEDTLLNFQRITRYDRDGKKVSLHIIDNAVEELTTFWSNGQDRLQLSKFQGITTGLTELAEDGTVIRQESYPLPTKMDNLTDDQIGNQ